MIGTILITNCNYTRKYYSLSDIKHRRTVKFLGSSLGSIQLGKCWCSLRCLLINWILKYNLYNNSHLDNSRIDLSRGHIHPCIRKSKTLQDIMQDTENWPATIHPDTLYISLDRSYTPDNNLYHTINTPTLPHSQNTLKDTQQDTTHCTRRHRSTTNNMFPMSIHNMAVDSVGKHLRCLFMELK
jgi:hypothetical protein